MDPPTAAASVPLVLIRVWTPLTGEARDRFERALHAADRRLGVGVRGSAGGTEFTLMIREADEQKARARADTLIECAASQCETSEDDLARMNVVGIEMRRLSLTGRPRLVKPPPGGYRSVDAGVRGRLRAMHEGPMGEWVVYLEGQPARAWAGRSLFAVLWELWELPHGRPDPWFYELVEQLAGHQTPDGIRYACPCCDQPTLPKPPPGTFHTCPVCRWEDDNVQFRDPDYAGGANKPSLRQARADFRGA